MTEAPPCSRSHFGGGRDDALRPGPSPRGWWVLSPPMDCRSFEVAGSHRFENGISSCPRGRRMETTTIVERDIAKNSGEATDVDPPRPTDFPAATRKARSGPSKMRPPNRWVRRSRLQCEVLPKTGRFEPMALMMAWSRTSVSSSPTLTGMRAQWAASANLRGFDGEVPQTDLRCVGDFQYTRHRPGIVNLNLRIPSVSGASPRGISPRPRLPACPVPLLRNA